MSKKAWSGRFKKPIDPLIEEFTSSIAVDERLAQVDIRGSIAHARMLCAIGILTPGERDAIVNGLKELGREFEGGRVVLDPACEDIHMLVERRLVEQIGAVAGKLHTARSRNDQVALDLRMWCRQAAASLDQELKDIQGRLLKLADEHQETQMPGFTHLQHAQPVLLAHHLLAYFWMFDRDRDRLADWLDRANYSPLGAGAIAGSSLKINREMTAEELRFDGPIPNSMDAVSDRDFAVELAFICSAVMMHLSRMSEEIVLWASTEFGFVELDDTVATGSSLMPQKKNPDVAELIRGKFGRVQGDLVALLSVMKGLPLAYMRDLQEDKPPLFDSVDSTIACLQAMERLLDRTSFKKRRMMESSEDGFSTATDLAEYLVERGVAFREAHETVGQLVAKCLDEKRGLGSLTLEEMRQFSSSFDEDALGSVITDISINSRDHTGGTAPEAVAAQLEQARQTFDERG